MRRLAIVLATACCLLPGAAAASASAAPVVNELATVANDTPTSAYGGWVVWSEQGQDGRWSLVAFHDGALLHLGAASRSVPFDADVGPDAQGRPTILFSRCTTERSAKEFDQPWSTAAGCRLHRYDPATGREQAIALPGSAGASDSTPSQWRGSIAFQRRTAASDVSQIMVYNTATHRLRRLPHGAVPHKCPYRTGCAKARYRGEVGELDLGARTAAFSWHVQVPNVEGVGAAWELRVDRLRDGASLRGGSGYVSGACGGRTPVSPNATATGVEFLNRVSHCDTLEGVVTAASFTAAYLAAAEVPGSTVWRIARDGADTYAVLGPSKVGPEPLAPGALRLVRIDGLRLTSTGETASSPFIS